MSDDGTIAYVYYERIDEGHWTQRAKTEHPSVYLSDEQYRDVRALEVAADE